MFPEESMITSLGYYQLLSSQAMNSQAMISQAMSFQAFLATQMTNLIVIIRLMEPIFT